MDRTRIVLVGALLLAACGAPPPPSAPVAGPSGGATAPPPARSDSAPAISALPTPEASAAATVAATPTEPGLALPSGAVYACVVDVAGQRRVTAIELAPKVAALCARNPEMGPCQYERDVCRRKGGRVYAADGLEITRATEAEYDRHVQRIRLHSN